MWFLIKVESGRDVGANEIERYLLNGVCITNPILTSEQLKIEATGVAVHPATLTVQPDKVIHVHDDRNNEPHRTLCGDYVYPAPTVPMASYNKSNCPQCKTVAGILRVKMIS